MLHYPALEGVLVCCYHHYAEPHIQGFLHRLATWKLVSLQLSLHKAVDPAKQLIKWRLVCSELWQIHCDGTAVVQGQQACLHYSHGQIAVQVSGYEGRRCLCADPMKLVPLCRCCADSAAPAQGQGLCSRGLQHGTRAALGQCWSLGLHPVQHGKPCDFLNHRGNMLSHARPPQALLIPAC